MSEEERPKPEELLALAQREENRKSKGKLKIFLGMAAGVGKTYSMLESAQKLRKEGVDLVVGVVNTHNREETAKLLEGMEIIPLKEVTYKDVMLSEMDIDAILKRRPKLVLVDELAHSNVPGSRHPKRWQDIMELLDHGIDVHTTLNIQHVESLKDIIEKIVSIPIRETVPDSIVERANSIELIDLTPEELLQRLHEGKVYLGDQSVIAAQNFFQEDRLTALREIVMRFAAEKVDHELKDMYVFAHGEGWKPRERLLVAISHSPHSQKLIRITRRLAFNLDAPWLAVHVDDGRSLKEEERDMLARNLELARDLGAEVITTADADVAEGIERIVRQRSVTQIVVGRPPKHWFFDLFRRNTLIEKLGRSCRDIDLHVIRQSLLHPEWEKYWKTIRLYLRLNDRISSYLYTFCFVIALACFNAFLVSYVSYKVAGFVFLLGILFLGFFVRKGPILFASLLYATIWYLFFIPPGTNERAIENEDLILLFFYALTAIFAGVLTDRAKKDKELLTKREKSIESLYEIVREIATAESPEQLLKSVKEHIGSVLGGQCEIAMKAIDNGLTVDASKPPFNDDKERVAAEWVFQNGQMAGWSTATLPYASYLYLPLRGRKEIVGVLAYKPREEIELNIDETNFLHTVGQQIANYFERVFAEERARKLEHHQQVEKIYESILNLLANLFEGPLLTIQDGVKELKHVEAPRFTTVVAQPLEKIATSTESLGRILENILAMVNLSAGLTPVKRGKHAIDQLVRDCFETVKKTINTHTWTCQLDVNLPEIIFDYELIELLFYNLAFHVVEYAYPDTTIEVTARVVGDYLSVAIAGEGSTIPPELVDVTFEKLYRLPTASSTGLGLGLAIAHAIAQIHNGHLKIHSRPEGGMVFAFLLPIEC